MNKEISFGRIVKEHRRAHDLTQAELARRVACATITIRKIEADALRPSQQIAERLAMALAIPLDERAAFVRLARTSFPRTPTPPPLPTPIVSVDEIGDEDLTGRAIRGYDLGERIGTGGFGVVYRAVQPLIDREVAIKIILPHYANHPDFIRRFEAEAQLVARLEHPYIVPLYDYWREPEVAYLAMRFLRGGNLQDMLKTGPVPLPVVSRLLEQIGAALHTAHRAGVIHRDIKPANVLLDEDSNGYLADFGIAKNLNLDDQTQAGEVIGSPAYLSPEQIKAEPIRPQADIYCLGIMLYELLTGQKPFQGPTPVAYIHQHLDEPLPSLTEKCPDLPASLDPVIQKATAKEPSDRYPDILNFVDDFQQAAALPATTTPWITTHQNGDDIDNPFKGLRPFGEADAVDFFGRETLVQTLLGRMAEAGDLSRFLAVIGPSGSGKSSVVRAGLVPALRQGGLPCSDDWFIVEMMPGTHPLEELEAALLRVAVNPPESLLAQLQEDERGLLRAVRRILPNDPVTELVLVIDQFEEIFTLCDDEKVRAHLLDSLVTAVLDQRSRLRVIITLRADFTDRPLQYVDFGELVRQRTEFVLPLTPDELEDVILKPAERVGLTVEPGLTDTIIADLGNQPGTLPLLQYTLTELFERRVGHTLTLGAYQASGGVRGALASRADELYTELDEPGQQAARQLFLRLITPGEFTGDGLTAPDTRRRVLRSELSSLMADGQPPTTGRDGSQPVVSGQRSAVIDSVIDQFGRHRLLTFDRDPATRNPTVEVAHEALIREWQRLRNWLDEDREFLLWQQRLRAALLQWDASDHDDGALLRGAPLSEAENWFNQRQKDLIEAEQNFIQAGLDLQKQRAAEQEAQRQRELEAAQKLAETERHRAEEQTQSAQRLRQRALFLFGALIVAGILAVVAVIFGQQASQNEQEAVAQQAVAVSQKATAETEAESRATAQAEAESQKEQANTQKAIAETEAERRAAAEVDALQQRDEALKQASIGLASQAMLELEGSYPERSVLLALEALEEYPYTWQAERALGQAVLGNKVRAIFEHDGMVNSAKWSNNKTRILTASDDTLAKIWDATTGELLLTLSGHEDFVQSAFWSASDERILTASGDGTARIWDAQTGEELLTLAGHEHMVLEARWSPDESRVVTTSVDDTARVWDAETGEELLILAGHEDTVRRAVWSADVKRILTAGYDGTAKVWDAITGENFLTLAGHDDRVTNALWSPSEERIVTASYDGTAKIWNATTGEEIFTLAGHTQEVEGVAWSPDGSRIVTASNDGLAKVWDAETSEQTTVFSEHETLLTVAAWSPDGDRIVTGSGDGTARVWDATTGKGIITLFGHTSDVYNVTWSSSGDHLLTTSTDGTAKLWHLDPTLLTISDPAGFGFVGWTGWSPDGNQVGWGYGNGRAVVYDTTTGKDILTLVGHEGEVSNVRWSPNGDRIATASFDNTAKVWDAVTGEEILTLSGHQDWVFYAKWSPEGKRIATTSWDGTAKVWDADTGRELLTFTDHEGEVNVVDWSPDGTMLVTTSWDGTARIWDADTGRVTRILYSEGFGFPVTGVAWSPDGNYIAAFSDDGIGRIWDADTGEEVRRLSRYSSGVWGISWSQDGDRLLTSGTDGTAKIWDTHTGSELLSYNVGGFVATSWSPDETRIVTASDKGTLMVWPTWQSTEELIDYAKDCCTVRELTDTERELFGLVVEQKN